MIAVMIALLPAGAVNAEETPLDTRLYRQALKALEAGEKKEGARLLRRVYTEFPTSRHASGALLRFAGLIYPVTSWEKIGTATPRMIQEATELLDRIVRKQRGSKEAPYALVRLGYLALEPANPEWDLDAACMRFNNAVRLHPESDAAAAALLGSGMCESLRGQPARAARSFERLVDEHPSSRVAPDALYRLGVALSRLDSPAEAMMVLERVRSSYPDAPQAPLALERLTLLHRMRLLPLLKEDQAGGAGKNTPGRSLYAFDVEFGAEGGDAGSAGAIRGSSDIAIDARGRVVVASRKSPGVFRLTASGAVQDRIDHPGPEFIAVGEGQAVYISGRNQIAVNTSNWSGAELQGLDGRVVRKFGPIALDPTGRVYLIDAGASALLIYDRSRQLVGHVRPPSGEKGRFVDVATGEDGAVYALDDRARMVVVLHQGRVTGRIPLDGLGIQEPTALAVDTLGDLFVLDGRTGAVFVADQRGESIDVVRPPREVASLLGTPSALAVDGTGRIYLCGSKSGRVVRFQ